MTPERAADKEKRALFRAVAFFLSDLKLSMTKLLIFVSIAELSENFKLADEAKRARSNAFLGGTSEPPSKKLVSGRSRLALWRILLLDLSACRR
jgi:hypothetical protein